MLNSVEIMGVVILDRVELKTSVAVATILILLSLPLKLGARGLYIRCLRFEQIVKFSVVPYQNLPPLIKNKRVR